MSSIVRELVNSLEGRRHHWRALALALALVSLSCAPAIADDGIVLSFADTGGRTITLDEPGVLYLVDFWALGCSPCMQEMPELARLAKEQEPSGRFKLISVVAGGWKGADLASIETRYSTGHEVYADPENWTERLDINAFPTKLLIRDGKLLQRSRGGGAGAYGFWNRTVRNQLQSAPAVNQP